MTQERPKVARKGPSLPPRWPMLAQDETQDSPRWPKLAPKMAAKMAQDGPRWAQDEPKMAQDEPKRPQDKKLLLRSGIDITNFPFFEDLPREIDVFEPQHKPVLALEREAR